MQSTNLKPLLSLSVYNCTNIYGLRHYLRRELVTSGKAGIIPLVRSSSGPFKWGPHIYGFPAMTELTVFKASPTTSTS